MNNYILDKNNTFNYVQYKKNIHTKNDFSIYLLFFIIILLIALCVFFYPRPKNFNEFYFAEIGNFQTYKEAIKLSQTVSNDNGAGYVYFDETYHVLASFYSSLKDAEKVTENLKKDYPSAKVLTVKCERFLKQKNLNSSQNKSIKNLIETTQKTILQLEKLSLDFSTNKINFTEAKINIKKYNKTFLSAHDDFLKNFQYNSIFNTAKEHSLEIYESLSNSNSLNEQEFLKNLRYYVVKIAINLTQLTNFL